MVMNEKNNNFFDGDLSFLTARHKKLKELSVDESPFR
jgi:hypothetical protein